MKRRDFMAFAASPLTAPLGQHVARAPHSLPSSSRRSPPRRPHRRRQFATLLLVIPSATWRPASWRDIPPATSGNPFVVIDRYEPSAVGTCRAVAKMHNLGQLRGEIRTWAIVACTDGRFVAETEGGAT